MNALSIRKKYRNHRTNILWSWIRLLNTEIHFFIIVSLPRWSWTWVYIEIFAEIYFFWSLPCKRISIVFPRTIVFPCSVIMNLLPKSVEISNLTLTFYGYWTAYSSPDSLLLYHLWASIHLWIPYRQDRLIYSKSTATPIALLTIENDVVLLMYQSNIPSWKSEPTNQSCQTWDKKTLDMFGALDLFLYSGWRSYIENEVILSNFLMHLNIPIWKSEPTATNRVKIGTRRL